MKHLIAGQIYIVNLCQVLRTSLIFVFFTKSTKEKIRFEITFHSTTKMICHSIVFIIHITLIIVRVSKLSKLII